MSDPHSIPSHESTESLNGTLETVTRAAQRGAADASEAAARTWTAAGRFASRFVYTTCYTISYGVVFPAVLLARSVPRNNIAVQGLIEGADAARDKVDEMYHPALDPASDHAPRALAPA
ncbi:hypothetical protein [Paludisphaera mucosa]|uniref:Uncharacterized protein n=1 Tax=Paludisphaera mucosa TaxID=3030827 RepID=A0ABT6FHW5_9BACT|nr:hypothetical protein [Paludisphaera mucosa]MDG3007109.1 hypothetical protein [Paludisphaera mucosa]